MSEQLTDWYPGSVKPARPGVYECAGSMRDQLMYPYHLWDGVRWKGQPDDTPEGAGHGEQPDDGYAEEVICYWRGLASDPNAPAKPKREPRKWIKWAVPLNNGDVTICDARVHARAYARGIGSRVIRVRVVEVL